MKKKAAALAELMQSKFAHDQVTARQEATRRARLKAFLDQHQHASQWAVCCAALEDGLRHGVTPTDAMICDAISRCGRRGQLAAAKRLYTSFYKRVGRARPPAAHLAYMGACAHTADFPEAHRQLQQLVGFDRARLKKDAAHQPLVNDDLMTEYLRAALAACVRHRDGSFGLATAATATTATEQTPTASASSTSSSSPSSSPLSGHTSAPWAVALAELTALRKDPVLRPHMTLTPLLLESATQLAEAGGCWAFCLALLRSAGSEQLLIPPEAYDAALRACYHGQQHEEVVRLMATLVATRTPPDERSVRLALVSAEEVTARARAEGIDLPPPTAAAAQASHSPSSLVGGSVVAWALSLTLFEAMRRNGVPLLQQSYEAPLRTCAMAGHWQEALGILDVMRRDSRPVSTDLYRIILAARIEVSSDTTEMDRLLRQPIATEGSPSTVVYLAALRSCLRRRDWSAFERVSREMVRRDIPETYDKMRLLIEAAYAQGRYHAVLARFARFDNVTSYERRRVEGAGGFVRLYENDFDASERLLDMVVDAYERIKGESTDPIIDVAYRAALRRRGEKSAGPPLAGRAETPDWMFSRAAREERAPKAFQ